MKIDFILDIKGFCESYNQDDGTLMTNLSKHLEEKFPSINFLWMQVPTGYNSNVDEETYHAIRWAIAHYCLGEKL